MGGANSFPGVSLRRKVVDLVLAKFLQKDGFTKSLG